MSDEKGRNGRDLEDFDKRLSAFKKSVMPEKSPKREAHPVGTMLWLAFYVVSELVGGVLCGLAIGWGLDKWLNTRPVFVAIFLIIGCIAAVLNVIRYLKGYEESKRRKNEENR